MAIRQEESVGESGRDISRTTGSILSVEQRQCHSENLSGLHKADRKPDSWCCSVMGEDMDSEFQWLG